MFKIIKMKTNYQQWYMYYANDLLPYYYRFCSLFERGGEPSFNQFMTHCFRNTKQNYNRRTNTYNAAVY